MKANTEQCKQGPHNSVPHTCNHHNSLVLFSINTHQIPTSHAVHLYKTRRTARSLYSSQNTNKQSGLQWRATTALKPQLNKYGGETQQQQTSPSKHTSKQHITQTSFTHTHTHTHKSKKVAGQRNKYCNQPIAPTTKQAHQHQQDCNRRTASDCHVF